MLKDILYINVTKMSCADGKWVLTFMQMEDRLSHPPNCYSRPCSLLHGKCQYYIGHALGYQQRHQVPTSVDVRPQFPLADVKICCRSVDLRVWTKREHVQAFILPSACAAMLFVTYFFYAGVNRVNNLSSPTCRRLDWFCFLKTFCISKDWFKSEWCGVSSL